MVDQTREVIPPVREKLKIAVEALEYALVSFSGGSLVDD